MGVCFCVELWFITGVKVFVWHGEPFKTRPVSVCLSASSSFLLFGGFRRRRVLSFSLSLYLSLSLSLSLFLRRWGNPNLFGLGFPLCFRGHPLALLPVLRGRHLPPGHLPHLFFFFLTPFVFLVVVGLGWLWLLLASLSLSLFVGSGALCACMHSLDREGGWPIRRRPRLLSQSLFFGG